MNSMGSSDHKTPVIHDSHWVHFYAEDGPLLDQLSGFLGSNLAAGGAAVVIASEEHRKGLYQRLRSQSPEAATAFESGRYLALDAAATLAKFMRGNSPDASLFAEIVGTIMVQAAASTQGQPGPSTVAFGEMVALLWAGGNAEAAIRVEQLWNGLARTYPLSLRCAYPIRSFDREEHSDVFLKICAEHSHVVPVETYTALVGEEQRARSVTRWQQKALALETEIAERKKVEQMLRRAKAELESQVEQRTTALRQLSSRLLSLQDHERRRIARELHDSLGQCLVGLKLNVDLLRQSPSQEPLWNEADKLLRQCLAEVRTLSYLLHPPTMDAAGFCSAARWYVEGYGQRSGLTVSLELPDDLGRLPDAVELALFRVLQEAMTNVHRHSGASAAEVRISKEAGEIILQVKDNGCGIPLALLENFQTTGMGMGVGLAGIRERVRELGGKLILQSEPACTSIQVRLPLTTISSTDSPIPVPQPRSDARKSASPEGAEEQNASSLAMSAAKP